jgi:capsular polysaccharide biosynthesis protein
MNNNTSEIEDIEVIPTSMYEPVNDVDIEVSENGSEDSEDFANRVSKTFEKDSSKSREGRWLAICELRDET